MDSDHGVEENRGVTVFRWHGNMPGKMLLNFGLHPRLGRYMVGTGNAKVVNASCQGAFNNGTARECSKRTAHPGSGRGGSALVPHVARKARQSCLTRWCGGDDTDSDLLSVKKGGW